MIAGSIAHPFAPGCLGRAGSIVPRDPAPVAGKPDPIVIPACQLSVVAPLLQASASLDHLALLVWVKVPDIVWCQIGVESASGDQPLMLSAAGRQKGPGSNRVQVVRKRQQAVNLVDRGAPDVVSPEKVAR